jgi:hypothetical protein
MVGSLSRIGGRTGQTPAVARGFLAVAVGLSRVCDAPDSCRVSMGSRVTKSLSASLGQNRCTSTRFAKGVDAVVRVGVDSAAVEQVAWHVLQPEAVRLMVKNATLFAPQIAPVSGRVRGRGVPTTR